MRNELLQERAVRQDLECDKISLERQVRTAASFEQLFEHQNDGEVILKTSPPSELVQAGLPVLAGILKD